MHPPVGDDTLEGRIEAAAEALRKAERVAALTGAGVSAESGVATFRGAGGLWEGHHIEEVATPEGFAVNPALVWKFYNARRAALKAVRPNPGHFALARLEKHWDGDRFTVITQNIDGLHRAAGSERVLELHGNLSRVRCTARSCDYIQSRPGEDLPELPECPKCCSLLRPDVVWFHEMLPKIEWRESVMATATCEAFLVVGTSAQVFPAAGLIDAALQVGAAVIEVNPEPALDKREGVISLKGASGTILPELMRKLGLE